MIQKYCKMSRFHISPPSHAVPSLYSLCVNPFPPFKPLKPSKAVCWEKCHSPRLLLFSCGSSSAFFSALESTWCDPYTLGFWHLPYAVLPWALAPTYISAHPWALTSTKICPKSEPSHSHLPNKVPFLSPGTYIMKPFTGPGTYLMHPLSGSSRPRGSRSWR